MKLKYILEVIGSSLIFQILDQTEDFRAAPNDEMIRMRCPNGLDVATSSSPDFDGNCVWLRGYSREQDEKVTVRNYGSPQEAIRTMGLIQDALEYWAARWMPEVPAEPEQDHQRLVIYQL